MDHQCMNNWKCPQCNSDMQQFEVKKEGKNFGKKFISCSECDHFQWVPTKKCLQNTGTTAFSSKNSNRQYFTCLNCKWFYWLDLGYDHCGVCYRVISIMVTNKPGNNYGRKFTKCEPC